MKKVITLWCPKYSLE